MLLGLCRDTGEVHLLTVCTPARGSLQLLGGWSTGLGTQTPHTEAQHTAAPHHPSFPCQAQQGSQGTGVGQITPVSKTSPGSLKGCKLNTPLLKASSCHDRMVTNTPPVPAGAFLSFLPYSSESSSLPACMQLLFGLAELCDPCPPC